MRRFAHRGQLVELAQPHLDALAAASGETINLAVPGPLGVEHLAQVESRHFLGTGQWVGRRVPYHCTAVGKVLVAFGGVEPGPLDPLTPATIVDPDRLAAEVARVRRDGYATAVDELEVGLTGLAAPVFGAGGRRVRRAVDLRPTLRLDAQRIAELRPILIQEARAAWPRHGSTTPHDARRDPAAPLRRDADRQRARGQGRGGAGPGRRTSSPSGCSTTR